MKYRRNVSQFADSFQSRAAKIFRFFVHQASSGSRLSGTSGKHQDNVVGNQFLHQSDVSGIGTDSGVIASYHGNRAADDAGGDTFNQRFCGSGHVHLRIGHAV